MLPYRLQGVTLMHIQVFILCAERLNFTRAAAELHITPGMVSKKIAALESALELPLFIREKNRVTLTPEGQKLLSAWGPMAKAFLREAEELRSKDTEDTTIRVGLGDVTNLDRYFIPLSSAFSAEEECSFRFVLKPGFDLFDELASGSCDVVFAPKFMERGFSQYPDLDWLFAVPSPLYAGLAESNPLRAKSALRVEDLRDMEVLMLSVDESSWCRWYNEMVQELFASCGLQLRVRECDASEFRTAYLSLDESSVLITDKYYNAFQSKALEFKELLYTQSGLLMFWKKSPRPALRRFIEFARTFYLELR